MKTMPCFVMLAVLAVLVACSNQQYLQGEPYMSPIEKFAENHGVEELTDFPVYFNATVSMTVYESKESLEKILNIDSVRKQDVSWLSDGTPIGRTYFLLKTIEFSVSRIGDSHQIIAYGYIDNEEKFPDSIYQALLSLEGSEGVISFESKWPQ